MHGGKGKAGPADHTSRARVRGQLAINQSLGALARAEKPPGTNRELTAEWYQQHTGHAVALCNRQKHINTACSRVALCNDAWEWVFNCFIHFGSRRDGSLNLRYSVNCNTICSTVILCY